MRTAQQEVARFTHLTTADVAADLNVSRDHAAGLASSGAFPDLEDGTPGVIDVARGKRPEYRIHPESLELFKHQRKVDAA